MLLILTNWIYIALTTFCLGVGFSAFSESVLGYRMRRIRSLTFTGIIIATVYAQAFSLVARVNVEANLILCGFCLLLGFLCRRRMKQSLSEFFADRKKALIKCGVGFLLFLLWAFFTSRGYIVPDSNLYHGQSIRWIEEIGIAKGIGLINGRLAYNSSVFALSALYDVHILGDETIHAVNGFLAFLMSLELQELPHCFRRKKLLVSDYARVVLFYYLSLIWDEIAAPSSDYAVMLTIFFVVIKWLELLETPEETREKDSVGIAPYCLLCVASVFALSLKLSAGLLVLLVLKPAVSLLREKRWKEIALYLCMGILVAAPWIARTYIISGWLFYPFTAINLFDPVWKMRNVELIDMDAKLISAWARGTRSMGVDVPISRWFLPWLKNELHAFERLLILGDLAACVFSLVWSVAAVLKKSWEKLDGIHLLLTLMACYLFWQISAPMLRYGYAYVLLFLAVAAGYAFQTFFADNRVFQYLVATGIVLFGCYRLWAGITYAYHVAPEPYYLYQVDYDGGDGEEYKIGNIVFYRLTDGLSGYHLFPVYVGEPGGVEPLGDTLRDGFKEAAGNY